MVPTRKHRNLVGLMREGRERERQSANELISKYETLLLIKTCSQCVAFLREYSKMYSAQELIIQKKCCFKY